jgi:hypothetical protein
MGFRHGIAGGYGLALCTAPPLRHARFGQRQRKAMTDRDDRQSQDAPHIAVLVVWCLIFIGLPMAVAWLDGHAPVASPGAGLHAAPRRPPFRPGAIPPPVEPMEVLTLDRDRARALNASVPFSLLPNPAARPFSFAGGDFARARAVDCMAAALWYEAGDDPDGERAVAQVVLNRLRHPAFPKTVCGVVFQGAERSTGCQFTFTCDGALARTPPDDAWARARRLAQAALSGSVYRHVGYATHYHTDWVVPYWSASLDKIAAVGSHLFFRWSGWWGTPPAFRRAVETDEPVIPQIARLSSAHAALAAVAAPDMVLPTLTAAAQIAAAPQQAIGQDAVGKRFGAARLVAVEPGSEGFAVVIPAGADPESLPALAQSFCAGRARCRILAWRDPARAPGSFPVDPALLADMSFSYIHITGSGLARSLWNCDQMPRPVPAQCMRGRTSPEPRPAAASPTSGRTLLPTLTGNRQGRYEQVTISPPALPAMAAPKSEERPHAR